MSDIIETIAQFVATRMRIAPGATCIVQDVVAEWVAYSGSTTGKCKLYAHIRSIPGVQKVATSYTGIQIAEDREEEPAEETTEASQETIAAPTADAFEITEADMEGLTPVQRMEFKLRIMEANNKMAAEAKKLEEQMAAERAKNETERAKNETERAKIQTEASTQLEIASQKVAVKREAIASAERLHAEKIAFMREENNKNRKLINDRSKYYSPYLDMQIYGTPTQQFIQCDSLKKVIGFGIYHRTFQTETKDFEDIAARIDECKEEVPIVDAQGERSEQVVNIDNAIDILRPYKKYQEACTQVEHVPAIAKSDARIVPCYYEKRVEQVMDRLESGTNVKSSKDRMKYVRKLNQLQGDDPEEDTVVASVLCGACGKRIQMTDDDCHRMHDVPNSSSHDWSPDNIYLGCSQCNLNMRERLLLLYKVDLYVKRLQREAREKNATR